MKKTRQQSVLTLFTAAVFLFGSSGGVAWGQTLIGSANGVNNEFGAGETSTITGPATDLGTAGRLSFPNSNSVATSPNTIWLGSSTASGKNIVINSYNAYGHIEGWVTEGAGKVSQNATPNQHCGSYPATYPPYPNPAANYSNISSGDKNYNNSPGADDWGKDKLSYTNTYSGDACSYSSCGPGTGCTPSISFSYKFSRWGSFTPYTSDQASPGVDDNIPLRQLSGNLVKNTTSFGNRGTVKTTTNGQLELYKRPTTVAIGSGGTVANVGPTPVTFEEFIIRDIAWWYDTYDATETPHVKTPLSDYRNCTGQSISGNCGSYDSWHYTHSGTTRVDAQHTVHDVSWNHITNPGNTYLDAAIQIMSGASVCVKGDITDATSNPQSNTGYTTVTTTAIGAGGDKTDALLVWPLSKNFLLRVGGNFNAMNMIQQGAATNLKYLSDNFPKNNDVQNAATNGKMYLYKGDANFYFLNTTNLPKTNHGYTDIQDLYDVTDASVLGVKGNYHQNNAIVHTSSTRTDNNKGVIEVGSATIGQQRFAIYSGGVIKNYSTTACLGDPCASIRFNGSTASGNTPNFEFTGTEPLYILNDGNCCSASITFQDADAIGEITTNGVNNSTNSGDLLIRAHGHVALDADATFAPPSGKDNNISILSDGSFIKTKAFTHTAAGGDGKGHLTLWAKGPRKPTPFSTLCGGAITIEGDLTTTSDFNAHTNGWQNMRGALVDYRNDALNSDNLARSSSCTQLNEEMSARTQGGTPADLFDALSTWSADPHSVGQRLDTCHREV